MFNGLHPVRRWRIMQENNQHMLLLAKLLQNIAEDLWANPKGEFLAIANADEVYNLFGSNGHQDW